MESHDAGEGGADPTLTQHWFSRAVKEWLLIPRADSNPRGDIVSFTALSKGLHDPHVVATNQICEAKQDVALCSLILLSGMIAAAQSQQMEEKLMALKQNQATNKQKLAQYTWQETETMSIKGSVKDTKVYQVQMVNGQQQKTEVSNQQAQQSGRQGRLKEHIVDNKKQEYQEYGQSIGALAKQYTTPDPDRLMQAKQAGNISLQPGGGTVNLIIKNYVKPGDSVTFTIDPVSKQLQNVRVASYLDDPKDAVTISAEFAQLPDGTNHVASTLINGESKQLTVNNQNSNYQRM